MLIHEDIDYVVGSFIIGALISGTICLLVGHFYGWSSGIEQFQQTAIQKGYAKMIMVDSLNGKSEFFWADSLPK